MYESITFEQILQRMLDRVPGDVDKREGSMVYNALAPAAAEVKQMLIELDVILNETFADTASRENLIRRAAERGLAPSEATKAILKGEFNIDVPIGSRFTAGEYVFEAISQISAGVYQMQAETAGAGPNTALGPMVTIQYIAGLTSAELTEVLIPGEDDQGTEEFRSEYFASFESQAFGGNRADYKAKTNALTGVGGCKVTRTPGGGGTVGVVIIDSTYDVPSPTLIDEVQTALDPTVNAGEGLGLAPIGHVVTVTGVTTDSIDIAATITYAPGWDWAALQPYAEAAVDAYFLEIRQGWQNEAQIIVRISQIESRFLNLAGVVDITGTTLDGVAANKTLGVNEIPERGALSG